MGMGFAAACADVFPTDKVRELCPDEYAALVVAARIAVDGEDEGDDDSEADAFYLQRAAGDLQYEGGERNVSEGVREAWRALCAGFEAATGLTLSIGFHDSENDGSSYDEVEGLYFAVDGMYQLSPAGERWKDVVERKQFVTFG
jgi:hypothetical protein